MLRIESFFKEKDTFVIAREFQGPIIDPNYISGAINIVANDIPIITLAMWDYIDQLWAYITDGLVNITENKPFTTCFPDQPIELSFIPLRNDYVQITVKCYTEPITTTVPKEIFFKTFIEAGLSFFGELDRLLPGSSSPYPQILTNINESISK